MPYCFAEGDPGWDEQDEDHPPRVEQFRYLPPPEVGGAREPVRFSDQPPDPPVTVAPLSSVAAAPSILDRLLRRKPQSRTVRATWEERQREEIRRSQHWLALAVQALRQMGARRAYCRYDGGNDEGFAWLEYVETTSGERLAPDDVAKRLAATDLLDRLASAGLWNGGSQSRTKQMRNVVHDGLAVECAVLLLGRGYGTGPYLLYGALMVDFDKCIIVDDRNADPIVGNIDLEV